MGKEEKEIQKQRIQEKYQKCLDDLKNKVQNDAQKNISEIERNIQQQNYRLEGEVNI
jgi:hypothetical protein